MRHTFVYMSDNTEELVGVALNNYRQGKELFSLQDFLDILFPGALPVFYTAMLFYLLRKKKWGMYRLVGLTMAVGIVLHGVGVLA